MKRALALAAVVACGCGRLDQVDLTRTATATVPAGPAGTPASSLSGVTVLDVGGGDALRQQGLDPKDVDSAHLRRIRLEVRTGASLERWLDHVALYVEAAGLPRVKVAERSGIRSLPADTRTLDLDVDGSVALERYLTAPSAPLTIEATMSAPADATTVDITATIRVAVNVAGLLH